MDSKELEIVDDDRTVGQVQTIDDKIPVQEDIMDQIISSDEEIIVRAEIMEPEMETFVDGLLQETDVVCWICEGAGKDYFHDDCALCDGIGKLLEYGDESGRHDDESELCMPLATSNPSATGRRTASGRNSISLWTPARRWTSC